MSAQWRLTFAGSDNDSGRGKLDAPPQCQVMCWHRFVRKGKSVNAILPSLLSPGSSPALRAGETEQNRSELRARVVELVAWLRRHGISERSCVLVRLANGPEFVQQLLAVVLTGAQAFVVDHRLSDAALSRAAAAASVTHELVDAAPLPSTYGYSRERTVIRSLAGAGRRSDDPLLQLSSGTTDEPKLIRRSESDLAAELERYQALGGIAPEGSALVVACSMASAWGLCGGLVAGLGSGLELVFPERMTARGIMAAVAASARPCVVIGVPFHVEMLSSSPGRPRGLTGVVTSGAALSRAQVERAASALDGIPIGQVYGMSEVGMIAGDPRAEHPGSAGRFAVGVRARVDSCGELQLALARSPYLSEARDDERWADNWFRTRDAVLLDATGVVTVRGRIDGLVSLGGKKFHVTEIERLLTADPSVAEALAFVDGGRVEAFVTVAAGGSFARDRALGRVPEYMRPHAVHVVDDLPRTASGKVRRRRDLLVSTHD
jgi:acyl-coenzyme A synthetase/AMP-(fatty) acid ligase